MQYNFQKTLFFVDVRDHLRKAVNEPKICMKSSLLLVCSIVFISGAFGEEAKDAPGVKPKEGFVPNEKVAISIATAVSEAIYGEKQIAPQKPFQAVIKDGVWNVTGAASKNAPGGSVSVEIRKDTGAIMRVFHSQ